MRWILPIALASVALLAACRQNGRKPLILATTTSTQDTGLLDALVPAFEKDSGYKVKVIAVGTGEALRMGERGDADVLLVHAPALEEEFMAKGFGAERRPVMHNDFVLLGPAADPANVKGCSATDALKKIEAARAAFVSRADRSGTHRKELDLWSAAKTKPSGPWYTEAGQGMGETLTIASETRAYTLADRGTYLAMKGRLDLVILIEWQAGRLPHARDQALLNPYHVITVSPGKHPRVNAQGAKSFLEFITGAKAQETIRDFGKEKYGQPLFVPDAVTHWEPVSE